jgi:lysophospholipase L1-like esterase
VLLKALLLGALALRGEELPQGSKPEEGAIQRPLELSFFFRKLKALEARRQGDPLRRVSILHLGDSHLQGDQFSRPLRAALGKRFGLAGRGLVFPHTLARSSNAWDLLWESNAAWQGRRSAVAAPAGQEEQDTGISGFSILTREPNYLIRLGVRELPFDTVSVFSRRGPKSFGMRLSTHPDPKVLESKRLLSEDRIHIVAPGDTLGALAKRYQVELKDLKAWNRLKGDQIFAGDSLVVGKEVERTPGPPPEGFKDWGELPGGRPGPLSFTVSLAAPVSDLFLRGFKDAEGESEAVIYGLSLERAGQSGVLYHTAGVNGAQLKSFARSQRFLEEARCLDPDLVLISLGTNEAMSGEDAGAEMEESLLSLMASFTKGNPKYVAFLLLTPPDVLDWHGRLNPRAAQVAARLRDFASRHGLALWDWQALMGGPGSVLSWREARWVGSDGVHMNSGGYALQSRLFFEALMEAYEHY